MLKPHVDHWLNLEASWNFSYGKSIICRSVLTGIPCGGQLLTPTFGLQRGARTAATWQFLHKDITIPLGLSENGGYVHRLDRDIMRYNTVYIYIAEDELALNLYLSISMYLSIYIYTLSYPINIQQFTIMFTNIHGNGKSIAYQWNKSIQILKQWECTKNMVINYGKNLFSHLSESPYPQCWKVWRFLIVSP